MCNKNGLLTGAVVGDLLRDTLSNGFNVMLLDSVAWLFWKVSADE